MSPSPVVTFVILNWRQEDETLACVDSVLSQDAGVRAEIVIVDNESTEESRARLAPGPWRLVALERNRGFAGGMNAGAAAAGGGLLAFLNNDVRLPADWLRRGLTALADRRVGILGGRSRRDGPDGATHTLPRVDPDAGFSQLLGVEARAADVASVDGSHLLVRKSAWDELDGFDDDFFAYYEEVDLCARALALGWAVRYEPGLEVWHRRGLSSDGVAVRRSYWAKRNRLIVIAKHFPARRWRRMTAAAAAEYVSLAFRGDRPRGERLGALWAAAWWLTHPRRLGRKRRDALRTGHHDAGYADRLRRLYTPPPIAPELQAPHRYEAEVAR
jgi:GT2 family glycosyltransferase